MFHAIKQLEDRNVANEINYMVWSDRMDLVAFSNIKGEVHLHRLTWTRAWSLNPPKEGLTVNGIAWRPDGKVLAVAYNTGDVALINIETKASLSKFNLPGEVSYISWIQERPEIKPKDIYKIGEDEIDLKFPDISKSFVRDPPPVAHMEGTINFDEIKNLTSFMQEQSEFNILVIGTKDGLIYLRIFGCWTCIVLDVKKYLSFKCSIENVQFIEDLSKLFVTVKDESGNLKILLFDTHIFRTHSKELYNVAIKYIKLYELFAYLNKILTSITETWESILLEIDNKLSKYASKVPEGGVTADFLDLLMFGICSSHMEEFLIHDLTKKGLEKFGQTVEVSYSNIQTYLFRHITKFSQNGTYHLSDLKGMALFEDRYGIIGLDEEMIQKSLALNGAFMIKSGEMQQIINHSVINYKAFFRWLYASIMHLMDEPISTDIQKMTQQDQACITEFLKNFDNYGKTDSKGENKFNLERLGQYLINAPLTIKPDMSGNDWTRFIEENECIKNHSGILCHYVDKSLVQVYNELKMNVDKVFETPIKALEEQLRHCHTFHCFNFGTTPLQMSAINVTKEILLFSFVEPPNTLCLFQIHVDFENKCMARCGKFVFQHFQESPTDTQDCYQVINAKFYSTNILSVLLRESNTSTKYGVILQLSLSAALEKLQEINVNEDIISGNLPTSNGSEFMPKLFKNVEMPVSSFAVSGSRRVSIVLSENKRKIKLYEMEGEEEEDEDADMTNSTIKESDVSMQESGYME